MRQSALSAIADAGRLLRTRTNGFGSLLFRDDFQSYEDDRDLMSVWSSNSQIFLCRVGRNLHQRLRCWIPEDFWGNVCVWVERSPDVNLRGKNLVMTVKNAVGLFLGAAHFYIGENEHHYRSVSGRLLKNGFGRKIFSTSFLSPRHFRGLTERDRRPQLTNVKRIGFCFSAMTSSDGASVEVDYFAAGGWPMFLPSLTMSLSPLSKLPSSRPLVA